jgi:hypothetical protein
MSRHTRTAAACATLVIPFGLAPARADAPALPRFEAQVVDAKVEIGYGLALGDVDGDRKTDILLADKREVVWYRSPDWQRHVLCANVTKEDNVCIAAADLDGDGKVEVAVGAGWNPSDTVHSGSVHYLLPPADRRQRWEVVDLPKEPTVHRMHWARGRGGKWQLIVAPLHGRGNQGGQGAGVRVLAYELPEKPREASSWRTELVDDSMHVTHNLELVSWDEDSEPEVLLAGREGVLLLDRGAENWGRTQLAGNDEGESTFRGASEVRIGRLPGGKRFLATVEPFHGHEAVVYTPPAEGKRLWRRRVVDATLKEGHAVACADLCGTGSDQLVAGWRQKDAQGKVGIRVYTPLDDEGREWKTAVLDDDGMACEDLKVGDLDGDGKLDVVAAGRATKNLKVYWNRGRG